MSKRHDTPSGQLEPTAIVPGAEPAKPEARFTIRTTEQRPSLPRHSMVTVHGKAGYTDDPITAHALQGCGYSVIDGLSGKEYTGRKPD